MKEQQNAKILKLWQNNQHDNHEIDIILSGQGDDIKGFLVNKGVWSPATASANYYAKYLYYNNYRLFAGKTAIDMGTGTGILGLVMALHGAKKVILTDTSLVAAGNTKENIEKFQMQDKATVFCGDLFEKIKTKADFIIFNHPFFVGSAPAGDTISGSILSSGELLKKFLQEAPEHLNQNGIIAIPFYSEADDENNPLIQGPKYGFKTTTVFRAKSGTGLQTGEITIHELTLENK